MCTALRLGLKSRATILLAFGLANSNCAREIVATVKGQVHKCLISMHQISFGYVYPPFHIFQ